MTERSESEIASIITCNTLRKIIGILGFSLPFVLALGAVIVFQTGIQSSVSYYYHTGMGDIFVGTLCAIGVFLLSYIGYIGIDHAHGALAGFCAVGMALFPTTPDNPASGNASFIGYIHIAFAALFFLSLIYFSLFLFTKTHENQPPTTQKLRRNRVYKICGYTMILCMVLIVIYSILPTQAASSIETYKPIFWLEAIAIVAFGIAWLIKGESLFQDEATSPAQT